MTAYLQFSTTYDEKVKERTLKAHIDSLSRHVRSLSAKEYHQHTESSRMPFVIMFVPSSAALNLALEHKKDLWRNALNDGVYIADEQTLAGALKIVSLTWTQIRQTENQEKIFLLAEEMLNRVGVFMERFISIGKNLEATRKSYDEAYAKLKHEGQSIPRTAGRLVKMGVEMKQRKGVPPELLGLELSGENCREEDIKPL